MKKFFTLKEIDNLTTRELSKMSEKELSKIVSSQRSVARKRLERIEESEIYSPAYAGIMRAGGIPSVKGMDKVQLLNEYKKYKTFLSAKTSTKKGAKEYQRTVEKTLKDAVEGNIEFKDSGEKQQFMEDFNEFFHNNAGKIYETLDWYRDRGYTSFINYKEIAAKIAVKMMSGYGKGNRGAFLSGLKRELDKEYAEVSNTLHNDKLPSDFLEVPEDA